MSLVSFELSAHTPLIHFENHPDATLRGSELKPKFDKFLIQRGYEEFAKEAENGKRYFTYRVAINAKNKPTQTMIEPKKRGIPLFFGNMGDEYAENPKYFVRADVEVRFFSFDTRVLKAIKKEFPKFLASINFGTRSSKGYGSFFIKDEPFDPDLIDADNLYKITLAAQEHPNELQELDIFYKFLRSGYNLKNRNGDTTFYAKPLIFAYAKKRQITWEKRAIKRHCFPNKLKQQIKDHTDSDVLKERGDEYIIRDLLGLSTEQQWKSYNTTVKKEHPHIKRFKSPIIFKPIKNGDKYDVYFWVEKRSEEKLEEFLDKTFTIRAGTCSFDLPTPPAFDMEDFLEFVKKQDPLTLIPQEYQEHPISLTLEKIFKTLQKVK